MNNTKHRGPKTLPSGMPLVSNLEIDEAFLTPTQ